MKRILTLWLCSLAFMPTQTITLTPTYAPLDPAICNTDESNPDNYEEIKPVLVGEEFTISLEANPSTGYIWELGKDIDESFIKLLRKKRTPINPSLVGTPIIEEWTFLALSEGFTKICFIYKMPWEEKSEGEKQYTVTVTIKKGK